MNARQAAALAGMRRRQVAVRVVMAQMRFSLPIWRAWQRGPE